MSLDQFAGLSPGISQRIKEGDKMEKDCTYYWNKVAILIFADLDQEEKLELAGKHLSKDELLHLKELLAS